MIGIDTTLNTRLRDLLPEVVVHPGGMVAMTAGEVYDADNPATVARNLGSALYQTFHTGRDKPLDLAMRTMRDMEMERSLYAAMPQLTRSVEARFEKALDEGSMVTIDQVRVRVPQHPDSTDALSMSVEVPAARPGLSPGFFYVIGTNSRQFVGPTLRLYAHLDDPESAAPVWSRLVDLMEALRLPWHGKILSCPVLYPRNDALVIYLPREAWGHASQLAAQLQGTGLLAPGVSPFTKPITESVSCAFEPDDQRGANAGLSFGQHRATVLAEALVRHAAEDEPHGTVEDAIIGAFIDANIDPAEPARNLTSPPTSLLGL